MPFVLTTSDDVWPRVVAAICERGGYMPEIEGVVNPEKPQAYAERMIRLAAALPVQEYDRKKAIADAAAAADAKSDDDLTTGIVTTGAAKVG